MQPGHFEELLCYFFLKAAAKCSRDITGLDLVERIFQLCLFNSMANPQKNNENHTSLYAIIHCKCKWAFCPLK